MQRQNLNIMAEGAVKVAALFLDDLLLLGKARNVNLYLVLDYFQIG